MAKRRRTKAYEYNWYGEDFLAIVEKRGQAALQVAAEYVMAEALRLVPRKSGDLAATAYWATSRKSTWRKLYYGQKNAKRVPNDATIVFGFSARHSHLVERKVKPHEIRPRQRRGWQAINIYTHGAIRARAQHPGNKGKRVFGKALDATRQGVVEVMAKQLRIDIEREMPR